MPLVTRLGLGLAAVLLAAPAIAQTASPGNTTGVVEPGPKPAVGDPGASAPPGTNARSMSTASPKATGARSRTGGGVGGGGN